MKHYHVVAAIIENDGRFLCMQKGETKFEYTSYKFEFPGGKVEEGETEQQALARELMEEMDYAIVVDRPYKTVHHVYPDFEITMTAYLCKAATRLFHMNEHISFRWLKASELMRLDWAAADVPIAKLVSEDTAF